MLRKKRSCSGCRALGGERCELGFRVEHDVNKPWKAPVPLEWCPKPLTYEQYFAERERQQRANNPMTATTTSGQ